MHKKFADSEMVMTSNYRWYTGLLTHRHMGMFSVKELEKASCASTTWLKNLDIEFSRLCSDNNSLYWLDDCDERVCLAFPTVLNLKGVYSWMGVYFTLFDELKVSFYLILTEEISSTSGFQKSITLMVYESHIPIITILRYIKLSTISTSKPTCQTRDLLAKLGPSNSLVLPGL